MDPSIFIWQDRSYLSFVECLGLCLLFNLDNLLFFKLAISFICILQKLWFQHVWPSLQQELRTQEVLAAALQPILLMIQEISPDEYQLHIMPTIRFVFL